MGARNFTLTAEFFVTMWQNSFKLATALRLAYPSARIVLTLCDPETLRWFQHSVTRIMVYKGYPKGG